MQLQPNPTGVLCSKHFEENLIDASVFRTRLRPGSIPTLFNKLPLVMHVCNSMLLLQQIIFYYTGLHNNFVGLLFTG